MSIVGVDLGCYTTYVAGIKDGSIEMLANEYSLLPTPTSVSFNSAPRPMGVSSKQQLVPKFQSTCAYFKSLLCRTVENHGIILDAIPCKTHPVNLNSPPSELYATVTVKDANNQEVTMTVQQVLAAYLTKIFTIAKDATGSHVEECLLAVPYYLTAADRYVIMEAAQIAGAPFVKLINETAALTASYAFFKKQSLPAPPEPPRKVVFADIGFSQAQLILAEVDQTGAKVLHASHSNEVGGFHFDCAIRNYFADEFHKKTKLDARSNRRAWLRLAEEAERSKKSVCAANTKNLASIECLMEDTDFKAEIDRTLFEELSAPVIKAFEDLITRFLNETKLNLSDVEVELVGGSSRVPIIRQIVANRFGREGKTTMNQDEAISRGTALMAGLLSPRVRKSAFKLEDFAHTTVLAHYTNEKKEQRSITLVTQGEIIPVKKNVTLFIPAVDVAYDLATNSKRPDFYHIAKIHLSKAPEANPNAVEPTKYRFPFTYDLSHFIVNGGCIRIDKEIVPEEPKEAPKEEANEPPAKEEKGEPGNQQEQQAPPEKPKEPAPPQQPPAPQGPRTRETRVDHVLTISKGVNSVVNPDYVKFEKDMKDMDAYAIQKAEAKNALEAYLFELRKQVAADRFVPEKKNFLESVLEDLDNYLYEDDSEMKVEEFTKKHADIKNIFDGARVPGLTIEEAPADAEAMDVDAKIEEPQ